MGERKKDPRLQALFDSGEEIYSISKIDSINNCLYGAYRTYKLHDRGRNNIYALMGSQVHEVLEKITNREATEADLLPALESELENLNMSGFDFPKDRNGGDSIRDHWVQDMTHFCKTYRAPQNKELTTEELFIYKTPSGRHLQGYIDLQKKNKNGTIDVWDYKTSTIYTAKSDIRDHARQLIIYTLGKEQDGKEVRQAGWIFLKYVDVTYMGKKNARYKKESKITKTIERYKLATELEPHVRDKLMKYGFDSVESDFIINEFKVENSLDVLPESVRNEFKMVPCTVIAEVNEETKRECIEYIENTIKMWESLGEDISNYPPRKFTKLQKNGKVVNDYFFCVSLCNHYQKCPYIRDFLDQQKMIKEQEEDDIFG